MPWFGYMSTLTTIETWIIHSSVPYLVILRVCGWCDRWLLLQMWLLTEIPLAMFTCTRLICTREKIRLLYYNNIAFCCIASCNFTFQSEIKIILCETKYYKYFKYLLWKWVKCLAASIFWQLFLNWKYTQDVVWWTCDLHWFLNIIEGKYLFLNYLFCHKLTFIVETKCLFKASLWVRSWVLSYSCH